MDYDEKCRRALKDQGLALLWDHLTAYGIVPEVEQTGGFNMALVAHYLNDAGTEDVIVAAGEGNGTYYVCRYPLAVWRGEDEERDPADIEETGLRTVYGVDAAVQAWRELEHQ